MSQTLKVSLMALTVGLAMVGPGIAEAGGGGTSRSGAAQTGKAVQADFTAHQGAVMTIRQGGIDYQVYRDPANGRLKLVTPLGRQIYLR